MREAMLNKCGVCFHTWMHPGGHEVSVRDAMLTVSPKRQKRRRILPTIPDMAGPEWMPEGGREH